LKPDPAKLEGPYFKKQKDMNVKGPCLGKREPVGEGKGQGEGDGGVNMVEEHYMYV
jgi:hypothetical protein